jgi:hypothetical protein
MIRITSKLEFPLSVPYPTAKGQVAKFFTIKPSKDGKEGVTELDELDSITLQRLCWHYDWRPTDIKNKDRKKEELQADQIHEIGLLKIELVDGTPRRPTSDDAPKAQAPRGKPGPKPKGDKPKPATTPAAGDGGGSSAAA